LSIEKDPVRYSDMIRVAILADMPVKALEAGVSGRGGGDAATWLPQLAQEFSKQADLAISWVILTKSVRKPRTSTLLGQTFYEIPKGMMTVDILTGHWFARKKLKRALDVIHPDVIHVWGSESSYPSVLKGARVPTIMSMQGILSEYNRIGSFRGNWRMRCQASYEMSWVKQATLLTSESEWGRKRVLEIDPALDVRLVEYGVNPSFYNLTWKPDREKPVILYCGGHDWRKGHDLLMAALRLPPVPSWKCWIAGGGSTREDTANLPENVEVLGNLAWKELQERMSKSWGLVLPTRADTSPNAVKEARVIGMPVITSRHGGQSGYVKHGENGIIVDPLTPEALRKGMDLLLSDYSACRRMGESRHQGDRDYFRPELTARGFMMIYRDLAGRVVSA
jgi:glycosyltransferase involved in cell wall biosynthesis